MGNRIRGCTRKLNMGFWKKKEPEIVGSWDDEEETPVVETTVESVEFVDQPETSQTPVQAIVVKGQMRATGATSKPRKTKSKAEIAAALPINERMQLLIDFYSAVLEGTIPSFMVQGGPGLGKTYILLEMFKKRGWVEGKDYLMIKAGVSAFGVYGIICKWADKAEQAIQDAKSKGDKAFKPKIPVLVFDDVPMFSAGKEARLTDMIKAMTDSTSGEEGRLVSWRTNKTKDDPEEAKAAGTYPSEVRYKGGVIIITNEDAKKIDKPTQDRAGGPLFLTVTQDEMMERMKLLAPSMGPKGMDKKLKQIVLNWLCSSEFEGEELSMRTLHKALLIANANPKRWKSMCVIL